MKLRKRITLYLLMAFVSAPAFSQEFWDLRRCVAYAQENNISVRQADIQRRFNALALKQTEASRLPSASFSAGTGYAFGRNTDPTTNINTSAQFLSQNFNLSASVPIFNWNRITNNIIAARLDHQAAEVDVERAKNDIALSVANAYLQALLSHEQVRIARLQVAQDSAQLADVRRRVEAGAVPELDALQLEAQMATDSANLISAKASAELNLLQLRALLNLDMDTPFAIATPPVESIPLESLADLEPSVVYAFALKNQPAQRANELRIKSLEAMVKSTRAGLYPSITAYGGLGTNFSSANTKIIGTTFNGYTPIVPGGIYDMVDINGVQYPVQQPIYSVQSGKKRFGEYWTGWGDQINNNFGQNLGISISVPLFNGYNARTAYERSKLNVKNQELTLQQANLQLSQDIYSAHANAVAALQKYNASKVALAASEKAADFAQKRYEVGLLSTFDLITSQNNLSRARVDVSNALFDYVFKMKVLEFYKGVGLKL